MDKAYLDTLKRNNELVSYEKPRQSVTVTLPKKKPFWHSMLQILGNLMIASGLLYLFLWSYPLVVPQLSYYVNKWRGVTYQVSLAANTQPPPQTNLLSLLQKPKEPLKVAPVSTDFGIVIEKINANAPILDNVDPGNEAEYSEALKQGVAHAKGTVHPGENGNLFLFSHSTFNALEIQKYNAVFTLLNKLEIGDTIVILYKGQRFDYEVTGYKVVPPTDVTPLTAQYDTPVLTLQTCDPPGTDINRLIITADLKQ